MTQDNGQPGHSARPAGDDSGRRARDASWTLFTSLTAQIAGPPAGPQQGRYLSFPELSLPDLKSAAIDPDVHLSDDLTFIFLTLVDDRLVAWYPSARRPVEVALPEHAWEALVRSNPEIGVLEPVDEALLIRRTLGAGSGTDTLACLLLPSWPCFEIIVSPGAGRHVGFARQDAESAMHELWNRAAAIAAGPPTAKPLQPAEPFQPAEPAPPAQLQDEGQGTG